MKAVLYCLAAVFALAGAWFVRCAIEVWIDDAQPKREAGLAVGMFVLASVCWRGARDSLPKPREAVRRWGHLQDMPEQERDENQLVADLLTKATNTALPKGEDLLADPELQRQLREAKAREKENTGRSDASSWNFI